MLSKMMKQENKKTVTNILLMGAGFLAFIFVASFSSSQQVSADNCQVSTGTYFYSRVKVEGSGDNQRLEPACETPVDETEFGIYLSGSGNDPLYFYVFDRKEGDTYHFKGQHNSAGGGITDRFNNQPYGIKVQEGSINRGIEWFTNDDGEYEEIERTLNNSDLFTQEFDAGARGGDPQEGDENNEGEGTGPGSTVPPPEPVPFEADCDKDVLNEDNCEIVRYINIFINFLSAVVGVVVVIMIAVGGIQYTIARDDPQAVMQARTRIRNAIIALIFYLFTFAFLQWLIPGGIL